MEYSIKMAHIKYPLTQEAKETARQLVAAWDNGQVGQNFSLLETSSFNIRYRELKPSFDVHPDFKVPSLGTLNELAHFGLIVIVLEQKEVVRNPSSHPSNPIRQITLLQELRNAIQTDFEVSDYFLTVNAVGTIIHGDLNVDSGAFFQSAAAGIGNVTVTAESLPDELVKILGKEVLDQYGEIANAIEELRVAGQPTKREKMGLVIQELGRYIGHVSNTGGAITVIMTLAQMISRGNL
jgi:hypothetical protein